MDFKLLTDKAKQAIDERGGTERLKQDAERLRGIAAGPGSVKDKARAAGEAIKQPNRGNPGSTSPTDVRDTGPGGSSSSS